MSRYLIPLIASLLCTQASANELHTETWQMPSYERSVLKENRLILLCDSQPSRCPIHLYRARNGLVRGSGAGAIAGGAGLGADALYESTSSSSANNSNIVVSGDNNSITLTTSQSSQDDTISSGNTGDSTIDAVIENDQVLYIDLDDNP